MFQCPTSGFFLFYTRIEAVEKSTFNIVSMPYFGLLPFLPKRKNKMLKIKNCFNALLRASSFSTSSAHNEFSSNSPGVSMPYFGLLPFLHVSYVCECGDSYVSMPYFGLLPFLLIGLDFSGVEEFVSMPYFGLLPFLRTIPNSPSFP